jgi:hypothetical protein
VPFRPKSERESSLTGGWEPRGGRSGPLVWNKDKSVGRAVMGGPTGPPEPPPEPEPGPTVGVGASFGNASAIGVPSIGEETTLFFLPAQAATVDDGGDAGWFNPDRVILNDNARANAARGSPGTSHWLYAFDFPFSEIPDFATISRIDVRVLRKTITTPVGRVRDHTIQLTKNGTTLVGVNKAATTVDWPAHDTDDTPADYTFSPQEAGNPTAAELKAATFGVIVKVQWLDTTGTGLTAGVDAIMMQVRYGGTAPAPQGVGTSAGVATVTGVAGGNVLSVGQSAGQASVSGFTTSTSSGGNIPPGNWQMIWNDEFDLANGAPPRSHWFNGPQVGSPTWRHGIISDADVFHDGNSHIVLRVRCGPDGKGYAPYLCTNPTGVSPVGAGHTTFGPNGWIVNNVATNPPGMNGLFIEWRANLSDFRPGGAWCGCWMHAAYGQAYTGDPANGNEVDVLEFTPYVNPNNGSRELLTNFNTAVYWGLNAGENSRPDPRRTNTLTLYGINLEDDAYHNWGLEWYNDKQVFYFDGHVYWTNTVGVSTAEKHGVRITIEVLQNAFGLNSGTVCTPNTNAGLRVGPNHFRIDYVRIYRKV